MCKTPSVSTFISSFVLGMKPYTLISSAISVMNITQPCNGFKECRTNLGIAHSVSTTQCNLARSPNVLTLLVSTFWGKEILKLQYLNNLSSWSSSKSRRILKRLLLFSSTDIKIWLIPLVDNCHCVSTSQKNLI
jgi:hypothetical protein